MVDQGAAPVAQVWEMTGIDASDSEAIDAIVTGMLPRIEQRDGFLGGFLMLDRERSVLLGITFWVDAERRDAPYPLRGTYSGATMTMLSADGLSFENFEVLSSGPPAYVSPAPVAMFWEMDGVDTTDTEAIEMIVSEVLPRIEERDGCLGTYLMIDRERSVLCGLTSWADAERRDAVSGARAAYASAAMSMLSTDSITFQGLEVLAGEPPVSPGWPARTPS